MLQPRVGVSSNISPKVRTSLTNGSSGKTADWLEVDIKLRRMEPSYMCAAIVNDVRTDNSLPRQYL